jgi:hypothetical protein
MNLSDSGVIHPSTVLLIGWGDEALPRDFTLGGKFQFEGQTFTAFECFPGGWKCRVIAATSSEGAEG